jgi:hypothetical protein
LSHNDRELAKLAQLEAMAAAYGGGKTETRIQWDTVKEL